MATVLWPAVGQGQGYQVGYKALIGPWNWGSWLMVLQRNCQTSQLAFLHKEPGKGLKSGG